MNMQKSKDELFDEAFALMERAEQLLLAARARHEQAAKELYKKKAA